MPLSLAIVHLGEGLRAIRSFGGTGQTLRATGTRKEKPGRWQMLQTSMAGISGRTYATHIAPQECTRLLEEQGQGNLLATLKTSQPRGRASAPAISNATPPQAGGSTKGVLLHLPWPLHTRGQCSRGEGVAWGRGGGNAPSCSSNRSRRVPMRKSHSWMMPLCSETTIHGRLGSEERAGG